MQHSCSHYNAFCGSMCTFMQPLPCDLHPRVAEHQGGTDYARHDPGCNRCTHKVPFIAGRSHFKRKNTWFRAPASSPTKSHATFMQPLQCDLHPHVAEHQGGTDSGGNDLSRNRRTHKVPFIAACSHFTRKNTRFRAPASSQNQPHATVMQPLHCDLYCFALYM